LRVAAQGRFSCLWLVLGVACGDQGDGGDLSNGSEGETADSAGPGSDGGSEDATTGGETKCGPSIADMVCVPEGGFVMGSTTSDADEQPERTVTLSAFWIDLTEVTADAFRACVEADQCAEPMPGASCTYVDGSMGARPVDCVNWFHAAGYCTWAGKRLPTEAEWEKAARGTDARTYPWGESVPSCELAVMDDGTGDGCGTDGMANVGTKPAGASPYGALDMAGNAEEWVADWYDAGYYDVAPDEDPPGPADYVNSPRRSIRGGAYRDGAGGLRAADRSFGDAENAILPGTGFRCARSVGG
jgi:serine/threonine-protein kinase